jgi:hypothetical protein
VLQPEVFATYSATLRRRGLADRLPALISDETGLECRVDDRELRRLRGMIFGAIELRSGA